MMFVVSLVEFSKRVQNEISAKVMPKPQNFAHGVSRHFFRIGILIPRRRLCLQSANLTAKHSAPA